MTASRWNAEIGERRARFCAAFAALGCDAAIVYGTRAACESFRYLTGVEPLFYGWLTLTKEGRAHGWLPFRFEEEDAYERSAVDSWSSGGDGIDAITGQLRREAVGTLAFAPPDQVPAQAVARIADALPGVTSVDGAGALNDLRRVKSPAELERLCAAVRIADHALDTIRSELAVGATEAEISARLTYLAQNLGGTCPLPPFVISGNDRPSIIRLPSARVLEEGDTVMIDMVVAVDGYQSDVSRTVVLGEPTQEHLARWQTVLDAYEATLAAARPGVPCRDLHHAAATVIEAAGYEMRHRVGHGIGLATSLEWPSLDTEPERLAPGMTLCIEPAVYAPGTGSLKLEDDLLIARDGCEVLSRAARELTLAP